MSSDCEQELYARTSKKQKEFLAQKQAAKKAVIDFIPEIQPELKRFKPEDQNSSDSDSWPHSPVKVKRPKAGRPKVAKKSNLKKIVDSRRVRRKKQDVTFTSSSSESDDNSQASSKAKTDSSSSPEKDVASSSPAHEDPPAVETLDDSPTWEQRNPSPGQDTISDHKYLLEAQRLDSLASKRTLTYPEFDTSCEQIDDDGDREENLTVKVRWRLDVVKLQIAKTQCFRIFHEHFSELEGVQPSRILITLRDKAIRPEETPNSIQLKPVIDILVAGVIDEVKKPEATAFLGAPVPNPNEIELKLQSVNRRETVTIKVLKNEPMSVMMQKYAEQTGKMLNKLKFKFDGEILDKDLSADELEFDGGECIDVFEAV